MFRMASWIIILAPIVGLYLEDRLSFFWSGVLVAIVWCWCIAMAAGRSANRTPIHTILVRVVLTAWVPFGVFMWWVQSDGGIPRIFTFWETCYTCFVAGIFLLGLNWTLFALARKGFGNSDAQLSSWESRGGHYFWDMIPWPWNPDSSDTRNGIEWVEQTPAVTSKPTTTSVPPGYAPVQSRRRK